MWYLIEAAIILALCGGAFVWAASRRKGEQVRRRVVEAHHPDLESGGGERHAGNLILLCKLHHDNYGRRLTRSAVSAALRGRPKQSVVRFADGGDGPSEVRAGKSRL